MATPRIDTGFSRALLDGRAGVVVGAATLEAALQQQVTHGGALDTLLLEAGAIDEETAARGLSIAWATDPVDVEDLKHPDPDAVRLLPERMATTLGTAPFSFREGILRIAVRGPLDRALVDEVATLLRVPVIAHVVPEVRVWQCLHKGYGTPLDERMVALLRMLSPDAVSTLPTPALSTPPDDAVAWDLVEAMAHLAACENRDQIAKVAVKFARKFLPFAAVFGVRQNTCVGWHRDGSSESGLFLRPFVIPPDCVLHTLVGDGAVQLPSPSFSKPALSEGNAAFFGWLGRRRPKSVLFVPIVVARRPVACLYGDGGIRTRDPRELGELTAFGARLGPAFEALLRQRHRAATSSSLPALATMTELPPPESSTLTSTSTSKEKEPSMPPVPAPPLPARPEEAWATVAVGESLAVPPPPPFFVDESRVDEPRVDEPRVDESRVDESRDEPLAPPPLSLSTSTASSSTMPVVSMMPAMPEVAALVPEKRDGKSPFAQNYTPPSPRPLPQEETASEFEGPIVLQGIGAPLLDENLARRLAERQTAPTAAEHDIKATLFRIDDTVAPAVWRGALKDTIEKGLQGGNVDVSAFSGVDKGTAPIDDAGWEDVVYDNAHVKDLDSKAPIVDAAERAANEVSFPELSTATLVGLAAAADDEDDLAPSTQTNASTSTSSPSPKDPPLATLSHKDLVECLFAVDDDLVARAARELASRGLAVVPALLERFPGRLAVDPFDPGENVRSAERLGALVDVVARLKNDGLDAAIPHIDSKYPAHRFAAVLLFALHPDARAIDLLRARLYDPEPRIRDIAAEALMGFLAHPRFESLLVHLRERSSSTKPLPQESRRRAVELLGQFRDVGSVPQLIALLGGDAVIADAARGALRRISLQDFGVRPKPWEKWWAKAKKRSRIDWLLEGLASEELDLRKEAIAELTALAGDDFGYRADGDKRARARALEVFQQWWATEKQQTSVPAAASRVS